MTTLPYQYTDCDVTLQHMTKLPAVLYNDRNSAFFLWFILCAILARFLCHCSNNVLCNPLRYSTVRERLEACVVRRMLYCFWLKPPTRKKMCQLCVMMTHAVLDMLTCLSASQSYVPIITVCLPWALKKLQARGKVWGFAWFFLT